MPKGKPDPKCRDCRGTGQITLFTSSSVCECVNRKSLTTAEMIEVIEEFEKFEIKMPLKPPLPPYKEPIFAHPKVVDDIKEFLEAGQ